MICGSEPSKDRQGCEPDNQAIAPGLGGIVVELCGRGKDHTHKSPQWPCHWPDQVEKTDAEKPEPKNRRQPEADVIGAENFDEQVRQLIKGRWMLVCPRAQGLDEPVP